MAALASVVMFASCDELADLGIKVNLDRSADFTIYPSTVADTTYTETTDTMRFDDIVGEVQASIPAFSKENLHGFLVDSVVFTLQEPQSGNFNWAKSSSVTIRSANHPAPVVVGELADYPMDVMKVTVPGGGVDFADRLKDDWFIFEVVTASDEVILVEHKINGKFFMKVW